MSEWKPHWERIHVKREDLECEYGLAEPVRFLGPGDVTMYDGNGEMVYCKCGEPATESIIGKECYVNFCSKCSPMEYNE